VLRLPAGIRISLKKQGGPTHRLELVRQPAGRRYWVRREGRYSTKVPEATAPQIAERAFRGQALQTSILAGKTAWGWLLSRNPAKIEV
jgi:hypothetical protein